MAASHARKIGDALGAEISGVDLAQPLAPDLFAEIRQAWLDHLVIRFRKQALSAFLPEHPEMNVISNIKSDGVPVGGLGEGEAIWHADMTYVEHPPMA